jgi:hypothetical protein
MMASVSARAKWGEYRLTFVSALAGFVGIGLLLTCCEIAYSRYEFISRSVAAEAQVLSVIYRPGSGRGSSGRTEARVEFPAEDGKVVTASVGAVGHYELDTGQFVRIRYRPGDAAHPRFKAELFGFGDYFVFGLGAIVFLLGAYYSGKVPPAARRAPSPLNEPSGLDVNEASAVDVKVVAAEAERIRRLGYRVEKSDRGWVIVEPWGYRLTLDTDAAFLRYARGQ